MSGGGGRAEAENEGGKGGRPPRGDVEARVCEGEAVEEVIYDSSRTPGWTDTDR